MTHPKSTWTISADRRQIPLGGLEKELRSLAASIEGLEVDFVEGFEAAPDGGAYRDFVIVARATALDVRILEALTEELIAVFGFAIDISGVKSTSPQ